MMTGAGKSSGAEMRVYEIAREVEIEQHMEEGLQEGLAGPHALGRVVRIEDAQARYVEIANEWFLTAPSP